MLSPIKAFNDILGGALGNVAGIGIQFFAINKVVQSLSTGGGIPALLSKINPFTKKGEAENLNTLELEKQNVTTEALTLSTEELAAAKDLEAEATANLTQINEQLNAINIELQNTNQANNITDQERNVLLAEQTALTEALTTAQGELAAARELSAGANAATAVTETAATAGRGLFGFGALGGGIGSAGLGAVGPALSTTAGVFAGLTGAFLAYEKISGDIEKDAKSVANLRKKISQSNKSSQELFEQAAKERTGGGRTESNYEATIKRLFTDSPFKADLLEIEAVNKIPRNVLERQEAVAKEERSKAGAFYELAQTGTSGTVGSVLESLSVQAGLDNQGQFAQSIKAVFASKEKRQNLIKSLEAISATTPEEKRQIEAVVAYLNEKSKKNTTFQNQLDFTQSSIRNLQSSSGDQISGALEDVANAFEQGQVSLREYVDALNKKIAQLKGKLNKTATDYEAIGKSQKAIETATANNLKEQQALYLSIAKGTGASDSQLNSIQLLQNMAIINNPNISGKDKQTAALAVLDNLRTFNENLVKENAGTEQANKLLQEGYKIPAIIKLTILKSSLELNDSYNELAKSVQAIRTDKTNVNLKKIFGDKGPGAIIDEILGEYEKTGVVSKDTKDKYQGIIGKLNEALATPGISEDEKKNITGTIEFIRQALILTKAIPANTPPPTIPAGAQPQVGGKPIAPTPKTITAAKLGEKEGVPGTDLVSQEATATKEASKIGLGVKGFAINGKWKFTDDKGKQLNDGDQRKDKKGNIWEFHIGKNGATEWRQFIPVPEGGYAAELSSEEGKKQGLSTGETGPRPKGVDGIVKQSKDKRWWKWSSKNQKWYEVTAPLPDTGAGQTPTPAAGFGEQPDIAETLRLLSEDQKVKDETAKKQRDELAALEDSRFALRIAQANKNDLLIAQLELEKAKAQLKRANEIVVGGDVTQAQKDTAINTANAAIADAGNKLNDVRNARFDSQFDLIAATRDKQDPVLQARSAVAKANLLRDRAIAQGGDIAAADLAVLKANEGLNKALQDSQDSVFRLKQAQIAAMGDDVALAQYNAQLAEKAVRDAVAAGAGTAAINDKRAAAITAEKAARDAVFQGKLDDNQYLLDTGKETKAQYVAYLKALQSTLDPSTKQFKELEKTLYSLKQGISGDLQANLPTTLALPNLYEVRRLNQSGPQGYQDQRTQASIVNTTNNNQTITINANGADAKQVAQIVADTLGVGRNATTVPSRY